MCQNWWCFLGPTCDLNDALWFILLLLFLVLFCYISIRGSTLVGVSLMATSDALCKFSNRFSWESDCYLGNSSGTLFMSLVKLDADVVSFYYLKLLFSCILMLLVLIWFLVPATTLSLIGKLCPPIAFLKSLFGKGFGFYCLKSLSWAYKFICGIWAYSNFWLLLLFYSTHFVGESLLSIVECLFWAIGY